MAINTCTIRTYKFLRDLTNYRIRLGCRHPTYEFHHPSIVDVKSTESIHWSKTLLKKKTYEKLATIPPWFFYTTLYFSDSPFSSHQSDPLNRVANYARVTHLPRTSQFQCFYTLRVILTSMIPTPRAIRMTIPFSPWPSDPSSTVAIPLIITNPISVSVLLHVSFFASNSIVSPP